MLDFDKAGGLVSAIAQDHLTGEVLMIAWMNRDAFEETADAIDSSTRFSRREYHTVMRWVAPRHERRGTIVSALVPTAG